jgi:hypothetical protein
MQSTTDKWRRAGYILSFLMVAGVAARVSYSHIRDVASYAGQPREVALLLPLAVDGMMLIATLAMAEDKAANRNPRGWARFGFWFGAGVSIAANVAATVVQQGWRPISIGVAALAPVLLLWAIEIVSRPGKAKPAPVEEAAISVAEIESPDLPEAPVSPAIPAAPKATAARKPYGPRGEEYAPRTKRRQRTGK